MESWDVFVTFPHATSLVTQTVMRHMTSAHRARCSGVHHMVPAVILRGVRVTTS